MKKGGIKIDETVLANLRNNEDPNGEVSHDSIILNSPNILNSDNKVAFDYFLKNSVCKILTYKTTGGIILKLKLNDGVESPYVLTRSNNPYSKVNELLLKIVFINIGRSIPFNIGVKGKVITRFFSTTLSQFENEVNTQIDIFERSLDDYLEPICPGIVFSQVYHPNRDDSKNFSKKIIEDVLSKRKKHVSEIETAKYMNEIAHIQDERYNQRSDLSKEPPQIIESEINDYLNEMSVNEQFVNDESDGDLTINILNDILTSKYSIFNELRSQLNEYAVGFVAMEYLSGFEPLYHYQENMGIDDDEVNHITDSMARYEIARLYKLGYIHGDLHKANLLIDPTYQYFDETPGRVILIDFGRTSKVSSPPIEDDNSNLYEASIHSMNKYMENYDIDDKANIHEGYKWLILDNEDAENETLKKLSESRERQKNAFEQHVAVCDTLLTSPPNIENSGGDYNSTRLSLPQVSFQPQERMKLDETKYKPSLELLNKKQDIFSDLHEEQKNIFSILDPEKKFKTTYIKNYIATEKEHNKQILEYIRDIESKLKSNSKGGKYKPKRHKSKKNKKRKTRRRKTRKSIIDK